MNVSQRCDGGCRGPTNMISCVLLIALLVFGVNVATADDTATSASIDGTTVKQTFLCQLIPQGVSAEDIIDNCSGKAIMTRVNAVFDISKLSQDKVNNFFASITAFFLDFRMENNDQITTLDFGSVIDFLDQEFIIRNNRKLENINGLNSLKFLGKNVTIRGNRLLTEQSVQKLRTMAGTLEVNIQEAHECIVPSHITDLKELNGCHSVYGNLSFANWPIGTTTNEIKRIMGNVKIVNTDLTKLPFSQKEKIKIDGSFEFQDNVGLCWINDENYKDYFEVKGKVRIRNTPCPYSPSTPVNTTTKKTKKSKMMTTTVAPTVTEAATTKDSDTVFAVIPALSTLLVILL